MVGQLGPRRAAPTCPTIGIALAIALLLLTHVCWPKANTLVVVIRVLRVLVVLVSGPKGLSYAVGSETFGFLAGMLA